MKLLNAVLIDPAAGTVTQAEIGNDLKTWQGLVGGYVETYRLACGDTLMVDEDGGYKGHTHAFRIPGQHPAAFVGKAFIVGPATASGDIRRLMNLNAADYRDIVQFAHRDAPKAVVENKG